MPNGCIERTKQLETKNCGKLQSGDKNQCNVFNFSPIRRRFLMNGCMQILAMYSYTFGESSSLLENNRKK